MPGADEGRLRQRRVADALGSELVEQALAHAEAAAVPSDVLAHEEDTVVAPGAPPGCASRMRLAVRARRGATVAVTRASLVHEPRQVLDRLPRPGFGERDGASISAAISASSAATSSSSRITWSS